MAENRVQARQGKGVGKQESWEGKDEGTKPYQGSPTQAPDA